MGNQYKVKISRADKADMKKRLKEMKLEEENKKKKAMIEDAITGASETKAKIASLRDHYYQNFLKYKQQNQIKSAQYNWKFFLMMDKILKFIEVLEDTLRAAEAFQQTEQLLRDSCNLLKIVGGINVGATFKTLTKYMKKFNKIFDRFDREIDGSLSIMDKAFGKKSKKDKDLSDEEILRRSVASAGLDFDALPQDSNFIVGQGAPASSTTGTSTSGGDNGSDGATGSGHLPSNF